MTKGKICRKEEKILSKDEIKALLDETIYRMRQQNIKDKRLSKQEFQLRMHDMITKTYKITRRKNQNEVNIFNESYM